MTTRFGTTRHSSRTMLPATANDPRLFDIASDVAVRLKGHDSYGGEKGALRALQRRAPGFTPEDYQAVLTFFYQVYDRAAEAIPRNPAHRPDKTSKFAEFEDIDYAACLRELDEIEPGVALNEKHGILNWCIFWHYLK